MRLRQVGRTALLIECDDPGQVEAWRRELWRRRETGDLAVVDIVPGAGTVLLDGVGPGTAALLASLTPLLDAAALAEGPLVEVPTVFDGEDLADVADLWQVSVDDAIGRLASVDFTVAFSGFAPGFGYMRGLPEEWAVPRLAAPRPRVPAGSVALADAYCGIYPSASPGGWRLVGRTAMELFDVRRDDPATLSPGARVKLVPAS
ncbi:5-oxoprolinase subunit B family protein [Paractinoplanes atraurantiacus]|uniref:Sensor histidine kinase inhibitor, KipI family n=1 Tax=Paractinoplanes atraurantiacus TaxID=1036182 RepID=A0A285JSW8_9ACTN|nr:allophanate hydrolase subunit 1 [Actinoplanes atraurantiacus]SNY63368.1 sensor histidine kinase inhibitor, KipI family [Actinoplanes atraurantiacus]